MTLKEKIIAARKRIENPENWTQRVFARNKDGDPLCIHPMCIHDPGKEAFSFCASAALLLEGVQGASDVFWTLTALLPHQSLSDFNDSHTHEEVLALFDRAIALCEP